MRGAPCISSTQPQAGVFKREPGLTMIVLEQELSKFPNQILKFQGFNLKSEGDNLLSILFAAPPIIPPKTARKKEFVKNRAEVGHLVEGQSTKEKTSKLYTILVSNQDNKSAVSVGSAWS